MKIIITLFASFLITSCSCYYVEIRDPGEMPGEFAIGTKVTTTSELYGSLEEFVDDSSVHYIYINTGRTAKKRYVLEQFTIPQGTEFTVVGHKKSRHPFACKDTKVLLKPSSELSKSKASASVSYHTLLDSKLFKQK